MEAIRIRRQKVIRVRAEVIRYQRRARSLEVQQLLASAPLGPIRVCRGRCGSRASVVVRIEVVYEREVIVVN
jgi:hypothetical protein